MLLKEADNLVIKVTVGIIAGDEMIFVWERKRDQTVYWP